MDNDIGNRELMDKLQTLNQEILKIKQELTVEKEESSKFKNKYKELDEQIKIYKNQIEMNKSEIIDETENIENENEEENDDRIIIYNLLKERLSQINQKLSIVETFQNKKPLEKGEKLPFQCICVIFNEETQLKNTIDEHNSFKFQTFRIYHDTTVKKIYNACLELWNMEEKKQELINKDEKELSYKLCLIENNEKNPVLKGNENIANMLRQKKDLKNAQFLLYPSSIDKEEAIKKFYESNQKEDNIVNNNSDNIEEFTQNIVGMSSYINSKYYALKEEETSTKAVFEEDEKMLFQRKLKNYGILGCVIIIYGLFLIFSILSLCSMKNPFETYHEVKELKERFYKNFKNSNVNNSFLEKSEDIRESILQIFKDFYYDDSEDKTNRLPFVVISQARISFYEVTEQECHKNYANFYKNNYGPDPKCYKSYYKKKSNPKGYYAPYIKNSGYSNDKSICEEQSVEEKFFVYSENYENHNFINGCESLENYFYFFFKGWYSSPDDDVEDISIKGELGYYGKEPINIFFSVNFINKNVLEEALKLLTHKTKLLNSSFEDEEYDYFSPQYQQACVVSFTLYNLFTNHYYYITFLYEFSEMTGNVAPKIDIIPFVPNLSKVAGGKTIKVLDVFRLLLIIFFCLITFYQIYFRYNNKKNPLSKGKHIKQEGFISAFLSLEIIIDIADLFIFLFLFVRKRRSLYQNMIKNGEISNDNDFVELKIKEYQKIAFDYQIVIQLESLLIILLLMRFLVFFSDTPRTKRYFKYLRLSLYRVYPYFIFYLFFCFIFAIFAQQIWGPYYQNFKYFNRAFFSVIEFSIFHVQEVFYKNRFWSAYGGVFTFMFFIVVIYFIMNTFYGTYLESYRLTTLKHGNAYDARILAKIFHQPNEKPNHEFGNTETVNLN